MAAAALIRVWLGVPTTRCSYGLPHAANTDPGRTGSVLVLAGGALVALLVFVTAWVVPGLQAPLTVAVTGFAAAATTITAINSNIAARANRETADKAREALARALQPQVIVSASVDADGRPAGVVKLIPSRSTPARDAVQIRLQLELDTGETLTGHASRLDLGPDPTTSRAVVIGEEN